MGERGAVDTLLGQSFLQRPTEASFRALGIHCLCLSARVERPAPPLSPPPVTGGTLHPHCSHSSQQATVAQPAVGRETGGHVESQPLGGEGERDIGCSGENTGCCS